MLISDVALLEGGALKFLGMIFYFGITILLVDKTVDLYIAVSV